MKKIPRDPNWHYLKWLGIAVISIILFGIINNLDKSLSVLSLILKAFSPIFIGVFIAIILNIPVSLPAGRYKTNVVLTNNSAEMTVRNASQGWLANPNSEFTLAEATMVYIRYAVISGNTANCIITCMLYAYSGTDKAFRPYSNLCPISGRDSVTITVEGVSA